jgi:hypothetical protein
MTERDIDDVVTIGSADSMSTPEPIVTLRVVAAVPPLPVALAAVVGAPAAGGVVAAGALEPEVI